MVTFDASDQEAMASMTLRRPPTSNVVALSSAMLTEDESDQTVSASERPDGDQDRGGSDRPGDHCECLRSRYPAASSGRIASRRQCEVGKPHSVGEFD